MALAMRAMVTIMLIGIGRGTYIHQLITVHARNAMITALTM
jgi:hypothetical protein